MLCHLLLAANYTAHSDLGEVVRLADFGAFIRIPGYDKHGLCHVSQASAKFSRACACVPCVPVQASAKFACACACVLCVPEARCS